MKYRPPGSSVHGILQARVLEWVAISFSRGSSRPRDRTQVAHIVGRLFTDWAPREATGNVWEWPMIDKGSYADLPQSHLRQLVPLLCFWYWGAGYLYKWRFSLKMGNCPAYKQSEMKVTQSCLTLCDPMDYTVHGTPQARTLEWAAFPLCKQRSSKSSIEQRNLFWGGMFWDPLASLDAMHPLSGGQLIASTIWNIATARMGVTSSQSQLFQKVPVGDPLA